MLDEIGLSLIVVLILILPLSVHLIEKNLEVFLFFMGLLAVSFSHWWGHSPLWSSELVKEALKQPVMITLAVLVFGVLFYFLKDPFAGAIVKLERKIGSKYFCFLVVVVLGFLSSVITAIIAAVVLVEIVSALKLSKEYEIKLGVLGCFSIGLGAVLTPVGEPLSTICIAKLGGDPYSAGFFFLFERLWKLVIPGVLGLGIIGAFIEPSVKADGRDTGLQQKGSETLKDILYRSLKVYVFVMALVLLGAGFKPLIDEYVIHLPVAALYWLNTVSAVVDNATLTAAEISPKMGIAQIQAVLMGLMIAGGMLIPGNVPNIVFAGRLGITSRQWAKIGIPLGFITMIVYFVIMQIL